MKNQAISEGASSKARICCFREIETQCEIVPQPSFESMTDEESDHSVGLNSAHLIPLRDAEARSQSGLSNANHQDSAPSINRSRILTCRTSNGAIALYIRVQGLESAHEAMPSHQLAFAIPELFNQVHQAAATHAIEVVENRRDGFILICDDQQTEPAPHQATPAIMRMLALATDLHAGLRFTQLFRCLHLEAAAMGIASGPMLLMSESGGRGPSRVHLPRDAGAVAEELAATAAVPGAVAVDESALWRWAAAARRRPPATAEGRRAVLFRVDGEGGGFRWRGQVAGAGPAGRRVRRCSQ